MNFSYYIQVSTDQKLFNRIEVQQKIFKEYLFIN